MSTVNGSATLRTRVKICGITTLGDALAVVHAGADALGFVFAPSPRRVTAEQARKIIAGAVPPFVTPVGVFVDEAPAIVADIARQAGLQALQLHGAETPEYVRELRALCPGVRLIKALRIRSEEDVRAVHAFRECCDAALLDAYVPGVAGGTGHTFNWELARTARVYELPIILAGGLTPENVADAVRAAGPYAVDVSTGVESSPGRKDPEKVRAFLEAVRGADGAAIRRVGLVAEVEASEENYRRGDYRTGTAADLMAEREEARDAYRQGNGVRGTAAEPAPGAKATGLPRSAG